MKFEEIKRTKCDTHNVELSFIPICPECDKMVKRDENRHERLVREKIAKVIELEKKCVIKY